MLVPASFSIFTKKAMLATNDPSKVIDQWYYATFVPESRLATGESLHGYYVKISAKEEESARFAMFDMYGEDWGILYPESEWKSLSSAEFKKIAWKGQLAEVNTNSILR